MNTKPILIAIMSEQSRMSIFAHFPKRTWTCCGFLQLGEGPQGVCELLQAHLVPGRSTPLDNTIIYDRHSGNAMHAVRTQCEVLDVGKYSHPSYLLVVKH